MRGTLGGGHRSCRRAGLRRSCTMHALRPVSGHFAPPKLGPRPGQETQCGKYVNEDQQFGSRGPASASDLRKMIAPMACLPCWGEAAINSLRTQVRILSSPTHPVQDPSEFFKPEDAMEQWKEEPKAEPPTGFPPEVPRHPPAHVPEWAPRTPPEVPLREPTPMPDWSPSSGDVESPVIDEPQNPTENHP